MDELGETILQAFREIKEESGINLKSSAIPAGNQYQYQEGI